MSNYYRKKIIALMFFFYVLTYQTVSMAVNTQVNCLDDYMKNSIISYLNTIELISNGEIDDIKVDVNINKDNKTCIIKLIIDSKIYKSDKPISIYRMDIIEDCIYSLIRKFFHEQLMSDVINLKNKPDLASLETAIQQLDINKIDDEQKGEKAFLILLLKHLISLFELEKEFDGRTEEAKALINKGNVNTQNIAKSFYKAVNGEYRNQFIDNNLKSEDLNTLITVSVMMENRKNYKQSEKILNKIITNYPEFSWGYFFLAHNYAMQCKYHEAIDLFEKHIKIYNNPYSNIFRCSVCCNNCKDLKKAENYCLKALKSFPSNESLRKSMATLFYMQNKYLLAVDKGFRHLDANNLPFLMQIQYAHSMVKTNQLDEADKILKLSFHKFADNIDILNSHASLIGELLYKMFESKKDKSAKKLYMNKMEDILSITEKSKANFLYYLGLMYFNIENYDKCISCFSKISENIKDKELLPSKYFFIAISYNILGKEEKALAFYEKCRLASGYNENSFFIYSYKDSVNLLFKSGKYDKCIKLIDSFLEKYEGKISKSDEDKSKRILTDIIIKKGRCFYEQENYDKALDIFNSAMINYVNYLSNEDFFLAYYYSGVIYFNIKKNGNKAKTCFEKAWNKIDNSSPKWHKCDLYYWMAIVNEPQNINDCKEWNDEIGKKVIGFLDDAIKCATDEDSKNKYSYEKI